MARQRREPFPGARNQSMGPSMGDDLDPQSVPFY